MRRLRVAVTLLALGAAGCGGPSEADRFEERLERAQREMEAFDARYRALQADVRAGRRTRAQADRELRRMKPVELPVAPREALEAGLRAARADPDVPDEVVDQLERQLEEAR